MCDKTDAGRAEIMKDTSGGSMPCTTASADRSQSINLPSNPSWSVEYLQYLISGLHNLRVFPSQENNLISRPQSCSPRFPAAPIPPPTPTPSLPSPAAPSRLPLSTSISAHKIGAQQKRSTSSSRPVPISSKRGLTISGVPSWLGRTLSLSKRRSACPN